MNGAVNDAAKTLRDIAGDIRAVRQRCAPDIAVELMLAEQALERAAAQAETDPDSTHTP